MVHQIVPLGAPPWPTVDPFLFCVHHLDEYPVGNGAFGPAASLEGRDLGMDFAGTDGWRMYHGLTVPGFPQHPHRGFETVTFVRRGLVDHADSLGARARYGEGDVQWLTAGAGIVHAEMFPLLDTEAPNPAELFQIWLNLPARSKMAEPYFSMFWADQVPRLEVRDDQGGLAVVEVVAGPLGGAAPPAPPPDSWASQDDADVAIWHVELEPGATWTMPPGRHAETVRTVYAYDGSLRLGGEPIEQRHAAVLSATDAIEVAAGAEVVRCLVLGGRPIGEPVASYGPFVMNTRAEIEQTVRDYQRTGFGGWPWPDDGPVHGADPARFAEHADGRVERAAPAASTP